MGLLIGLSMDQGKSVKGDPIFWLKQSYINAIQKSGGIPLPLPSIFEESVLDHYIQMVSALVITGGDFDIDPSHYKEKNKGKVRAIHEERTLFEMKMVRLAKSKKIPVLGICGGAQLINVAFGGTLLQHVDSHEGVFHKILIKSGSLLQNFLSLNKKSNAVVNSRHHQAIEKVAPGFEASAHSEDGMIEAIEPSQKDCFFLGVQWHPEEMIEKNAEQKNLFLRLLEEAKKQ